MYASKKKVYSTPKLTAHGALEEITKSGNKEPGCGDSYFICSQPILSVS